jgi:hypothetical protein
MKRAYIGVYFTTLEAAIEYAKKKGGRRVIIAADNGYLVVPIVDIDK